jgi:hypothetical protein
MTDTRSADYLDLAGNPIVVGFLAMEYYSLILNRTYFIMVTNDALYGAKMFGAKTSPRGGSGAYLWQDPINFISSGTLKKYSGIDMASPDFLKLDKANFRIPTAEVTDLVFKAKKKMSMGGVPHTGSLYVTSLSDRKREFVLLGDQDGTLIELRLRSVCPQVP